MLDKYQKWINLEKLRKVIKGLKKKKSPGPDTFSPVVLAELSKSTLSLLVTLYKACIALHFTLTILKSSKIVFIPKPGKGDYSNPNSYRPISLNSYLLKALEKLCVWEVEDHLQDHSIYNRQHGFRRGRCTESAISGTINYIESQIYNGKICLATFIDIK